MATFDTGRKAEAVAANFLQGKGCKILARNWRTRWCEIDIVASRDNTIYFCEVKYRLNNKQGSGLEYITPKKLQQMRFAAESWVHGNSWDGEHQLCALEVSGKAFRLTGILRIDQ
jgi:ribonuclease HII